jgi:hypothetical protein
MLRTKSLSNIQQQNRSSANAAKSTLRRSSSYDVFRKNKSTGPKTAFLRLHSRLALVLLDKEQAASIAQHELNSSHVLVGVEVANKPEPLDVSAATPATLEEICMFDEYFNTICRQNNDAKVVVYTGLDAQRQIKVIFTLGCHLIMTCGLKVQEVISLFKAVDDLVGVEVSEYSLYHYWSAFDSAKTLRWISFKETFDSPNYETDSIAMDEYLHYAR